MSTYFLPTSITVGYNRDGHAMFGCDEMAEQDNKKDEEHYIFWK